VYKSRLIWGDLIFILGFFPITILLNDISPDVSSSAASAVGLLIFVLLPLIGVGSLLAVSSVLKLTNIKKIARSGLNNRLGYIFLILGWLISIGTAFVCMLFIYALISVNPN
jgi:uncharacterized membrane protein YidH (DUF202 family)